MFPLIGLLVTVAAILLPLATRGFYSERVKRCVRHQRRELLAQDAISRTSKSHGWFIINRTALPYSVWWIESMLQEDEVVSEVLIARGFAIVGSLQSIIDAIKHSGLDERIVSPGPDPFVD